MKTIDLFRAGINSILRSTKLKQREIAIRLNPTYESDSAASDFNNFLHNRKNYSVEKQVRLATLLDYTYLEVIEIGEGIMLGKNDTQFILDDGTTYSATVLSKMTKELLSCKIKELEIIQMYLVRDIVKYWQTLKDKEINKH